MKGKIYTGDIHHQIGHEFEGPGPLHRPWYLEGDYIDKTIYVKRKGRHKDVKIMILRIKNRLVIDCQLKIV